MAPPFKTTLAATAQFSLSASMIMENFKRLFLLLTLLQLILKCKIRQLIAGLLEPQLYKRTQSRILKFSCNGKDNRHNFFQVYNSSSQPGKFQVLLSTAFRLQPLLFKYLFFLHIISNSNSHLVYLLLTNNIYSNLGSLASTFNQASNLNRDHCSSRLTIIRSLSTVTITEIILACVL